MRTLGYYLGFLLLLAALFLLGRDLFTWAGGSAFGISSMADAWARLDPGSLADFQTFIQGQISADLWLSVLEPVLRLPGFAVFGLPGLLLLLFCRPR